MTEALAFLEQHGVLVLFLVTLVDQMGVPFPSGPLLIAAGALVSLGRMDPAAAVAAALAPTLLADWTWFEIGRRKGTAVLKFLCRVSLEPDSCVRSTEDVFARHGASSLLVARFVPGLGTVAPPLAGIFGMRLSRFLAFDAAGTLIWILAYGSLGFLFGHRLEDVGRWLADLGAGAFGVLGGALALYLGAKWWQRQKFLRQLRIDRISPEELHRLMDSGEEVLVVDLRHRYDFEASPEGIPGAVFMPAEEFEARSGEIPRDREVVLYCT